MLRSYCGIVKINVGKKPRQQSFDVHVALLTARSPFFKRALNGNWAEAIERVVNLPEDDPKAFEMYVHLLYTGTIATEQTAGTGLEKWGEECSSLATLFVLAEKLQDLETKNVTLRDFVVTMMRYGYLRPPINVVRTLYTGTPTESFARKAVVDAFSVWSERVTADRHLLEQYPHDFKEDLLLSVLAKRRDTFDKAISYQEYMEKEKPVKTET
jgi:hypothetical protein